MVYTVLCIRVNVEVGDLSYTRPIRSTLNYNPPLDVGLHSENNFRLNLTSFRNCTGYQIPESEEYEKDHIQLQNMTGQNPAA